MISLCVLVVSGLIYIETYSTLVRVSASIERVAVMHRDSSFTAIAFSISLRNPSAILPIEIRMLSLSAHLNGEPLTYVRPYLYFFDGKTVAPRSEAAISIREALEEADAAVLERAAKDGRWEWRTVVAASLRVAFMSTYLELPLAYEGVYFVERTFAASEPCSFLPRHVGMTLAAKC